MSRGIAALIVSSFVATLGMVPLGTRPYLTWSVMRTNKPG